MLFKYANRAKTLLARSIAANETNLSVEAGQGALFPALTQGRELFALTLVSVADQSTYEICYVIARNGDDMTVLRGQEGTKAQPFESGDIVSLNMTANIFNLFPQAGYLGVYDNAVANFIGGYKKNAILSDPNAPALLWVSLQDQNKTPPSDQATDWWMKIDFGALNTRLSTFVSGVIGLNPQDHQGISLFTRNGLPFYRDNDGGNFTLTTQDNLNNVNNDLQNFKQQQAVISVPYSSYDTRITRIRTLHDQPHPHVAVQGENDQYNFSLANLDDIHDTNNALNTFKQDAVTGHGNGPGDSRVLNIYGNNNADRQRLEANVQGKRDIITACIEDVTDERNRASQDVANERNRAQSVEATLVSGTLGMGANDKAGRSLHTNTSTGRANYWDETGVRGEFLWASEFDNFTSKIQVWTAFVKHRSWVKFPKTISNFNTGANNNPNVIVMATAVGPINIYNNDDHIWLINLVRNGDKTDMTAEGFRVAVEHYYTIKDAHATQEWGGIWVNFMAFQI